MMLDSMRGKDIGACDKALLDCGVNKIITSQEVLKASGNNLI